MAEPGTAQHAPRQHVVVVGADTTTVRLAEELVYGIDRECQLGGAGPLARAARGTRREPDPRLESLFRDELAMGTSRSRAGGQRADRGCCDSGRAGPAATRNPGECNGQPNLTNHRSTLTSVHFRMRSQPKPLRSGGNLRSRRLLTLCTRCNLCRPRGTYVNVGFRQGVSAIITMDRSSPSCSSSRSF